MANLDIRQALLEANLKQWRVAESLGISESQFSKMLRRELPEDKKNQVLEAINNIQV